MRKNMTEAMEAKVRKFVIQAGSKLDELTHREGTTVHEDGNDFGEWCGEHFPVMEDPDAELMRDILVLLEDIYCSGQAYSLRLLRGNYWTILEWEPNRKGFIQPSGGPYDLAQLRDKLQKMLPPPVPTLEEAAEAAKEVETLYRLSSRVRTGSHTEKQFQSVARFFKAEIKRQAEKVMDDAPR